MKTALIGVLAAAVLAASPGTPARQSQPPQNLVENPGASEDYRDWQARNDAAIEPCDGDPCFVVRNFGIWGQRVELPPGSVGQFLVMIGAGTAERVRPNKVITGLPSLYGQVIADDARRIVAYLQGESTLGWVPKPLVWVKLWGIFRIPVDAKIVALTLSQASAAGAPHDGSASRFDDIGLYILPTELEAKNFVNAWTSPRLRQ